MEQLKEDLLKIITHYGVNVEQRKLAEETFELQEAITQHQTSRKYRKKEHIAEEIADVLVILNQFKVYYDIPSEFILVLMRGKVNRQLERIKNEKL